MALTPCSPLSPLSDLDEVATALFNGQLPEAWRRMNPQTEKMLGSWMLWFLRRFRQYQEWVDHGEPRVMWLSGLHIPETYIAALVQTACRDRGWPLDKSTLYTAVTQFTHPGQVAEKPKHGCYVTGLYLEGAQWNVKKSRLERQVRGGEHTKGAGPARHLKPDDEVVNLPF